MDVSNSTPTKTLASELFGNELDKHIHPELAPDRMAVFNRLGLKVSLDLIEKLLDQLDPTLRECVVISLLRKS